MFIKFKQTLSLSLSLFLLLSCGQETGKLIPRESDEAIATKLSFTDVNLSVKSFIDVLFVVDDSGSMRSHQKNLSRNTSFFIDNFLQNNSLDFRISITTTNGVMSAGYGMAMKYRRNPETIMYQGPFDRSTPYLNQVLMRYFKVGTSGSGTESVFFSSKYILENPKEYPNFYRKDAFLVLVFITDAEEQSDISLSEFKNFLIKLKLDPSKILLYGVLAETLPAQKECPRDEGRKPSRKIKTLIRSFGGLVYSLCDLHFGQRLADIGKDIISRISAKILLPSKPLISTIKVSYGSQVLLNDFLKGWTYNPSQNAIFISPHIELKAEEEEEKNQILSQEVEINYDIVDD